MRIAVVPTMLGIAVVCYPWAQCAALEDPPGGVATEAQGGGCNVLCDQCWCGTQFENNCPLAWFYDDECDCGCQFCDAWCGCDIQDCGASPCDPWCDYCWIGTQYAYSCPEEWCADGDCDCGCQWEDQDCGGPPCAGGCNPVCGDAVCDRECDEDCCSCPQDCGSCCGNGVCEQSCGEECCTCPQDCGSCCGNGVCDCGETRPTCPDDCDAVLPTFIMTIPPNCAIDARQATEPNGSVRAGWDTIDIRFNGNTAMLISEDFRLSRPGLGVSPICGLELQGVVATVDLCHAVLLSGWTCILYIPDLTRICIAHLPADVMNDRVAGAQDIAALAANLDGEVVPAFRPWQCDADRSGVCGPADILRAVDLLNGAAAFDVWLEAALPGCPSAP